MSIFWDFSDKTATIGLFCNEIELILAEKSGSSTLNAIAVAVSGGSDSMAALILTAYWAKKRKIAVTGVTVDHHLREESGEEALFVHDFCKRLGVGHTVLDWIHEPNITHGKLERLAREVRYRLIDDFCQKNGIGFVVVGHTWNDQLETFEMRHDHQSTSNGLAGMSRIRSLSPKVCIIRPTLRFTRQHLRDLLISEGVSWKDDPMNNDPQFQRVAHRNSIAVLNRDILKEKSKYMLILGENRRKNEEQAVSFIKKNLGQFEENDRSVTFDTQNFLSEPINVRLEILRRIIWYIGGKKYSPSINEIVLQKILTPGKAYTIGRCVLRTNKRHISIVRENREKNKVIPAKKCSNNRNSLNIVNLFDIFL